MKIKSFSPYVIALMVGAALGYCLKPSPEAVEAGDSEAAPVSESVNPAGDDGAANRVLRARIRELEKQLAGMDSRDAQSAPDEAKRDEARPDFSTGVRERMEEFRRNDPEGYARMTNQISRFRRERINQAQSKLDYFSSIDTSNMTQKSRDRIEAFQDLIVKREDIESRMFDESLSDDDRRSLMQEMWDADRAMNEAKVGVRESLLREVARNLGREADADDIVATVTEIIDATDGGGRGRPPMGDRGRRGPRGDRRR